MKKILVRVLAMTLVLMTMFALCTSAFAAKVPSVSKTVGTSGDHKYTFYVKTSNSVNTKLFGAKLKMTMTLGQIKCGGGYVWSGTYLYDYYYVRISYWDADEEEWVVESSSDKRGQSSRNYTLKKANTYYKIYVDTWTPKKVLQKYINAGLASWPYSESMDATTFSWRAGYCPTWKMTGTRCTLYTHNPVQ